MYSHNLKCTISLLFTTHNSNVKMNTTSAAAESSVFSTTKIDRKNRILYGVPEPENYTEGTSSLGELCLKNLSANPNFVVLVINDGFLIKLRLIN